MRNLMTFAILMLALGGCARVRAREHPEAQTLIARNCVACHSVPGVAAGTGLVGPSLAGIARRLVLAGYFSNDRATMIRWIAHPQEMLPGNGMPDTGLSERQAAVIADYLYDVER